MEHHEMAEKLVEKCGITYEEAGDVLRESNYDLLEAMIILERRGKMPEVKNKFSTGKTDELSVFTKSEKTAFDAESIKEFLGIAWKKICQVCSDIMKYQVVISKNGERILDFHLLLAILLLCCTAGAAFVVVIITLFNGCSYSIEKIM